MYDDLAVKSYKVSSGKRRFESTHLDDTVVVGGISTVYDPTSDSNYIFRAAADSGIFRTSTTTANGFDEERLWEYTFDENFQSQLIVGTYDSNATRSTKVVSGKIGPDTIIYTSAETPDPRDSKISIVASKNFGTSYEVIGGRGYNYMSFTLNNKFTAVNRGGQENKTSPKDLGVNNILVVPQTNPPASQNYHYLYAATDSGGFYFDPTKASGSQWSNIEFCIDTSCVEEGIVGSVIKAQSFNKFYLSFDSNNNSYDGVYLLDRSNDPTMAFKLNNIANGQDLHNLSGDFSKNTIDYMHSPNHLAITEDDKGNKYLLRTIDSDIEPMVFRAKIDINTNELVTDPTDGWSWELVFSLAEDSIDRGYANEDPRAPNVTYDFGLRLYSFRVF